MAEDFWDIIQENKIQIPTVDVGPGITTALKPALDRPEKPEDFWDIIGQAETEAKATPPEPSLERLGGQLTEGLKDIARTPYQAATGISQALLGKESPVTGFFKQGAEAPILKPEPEYAAKPLGWQGWAEDFVRSAPQMGSQIVMSMAFGPIAGMGYMAAQIAGGDYENLIKQGVKPERAIVAGVADALMQAPLEQFGISKFTNLFKPRATVLKKVKDVFTALGSEWGTEFIQAFPESITNIWATNPDTTLLDKTSKFLDNALETAKQGAYEGTLTAPWALLGLAAPRTRPAAAKLRDATTNAIASPPGEERAGAITEQLLPALEESRTEALLNIERGKIQDQFRKEREKRIRGLYKKGLMGLISEEIAPVPVEQIEPTGLTTRFTPIEPPVAPATPPVAPAKGAADILYGKWNAILNPEKPAIKDVEDTQFMAWARKAAAGRRISDEDFLSAKRDMEKMEEDKAFAEWQAKSQKPYPPPEIAQEAAKPRDTGAIVPPAEEVSRPKLYRGTTLQQWEAIQRGEQPQSEFTTEGNTWATTSLESAQGYTRATGKDAVIIEYKDSAHDKVSKLTDYAGDTGRQGPLVLEDVQRVTDGNGNVIYEAKAKEEQAPAPNQYEDVVYDTPKEPEAEPAAKAPAPVEGKGWKPSVGDTVYFEDVTNPENRIPANFRGFTGDKAVVVWNGQQMAIERNRIHREPAKEVIPGGQKQTKGQAETKAEVTEKPALERGQVEPVPTTTVLSKYAVHDIPLSLLKLSKDVPNFKRDANAKGVVRPLEGPYDRLGTGNIIAWERLNGDLEVITGRHRLAHAEKMGETTIPTQIVKESEGFTEDMAFTLDAESNIKDNQGSLEDYATYFRKTKINRDEASGRGLLRQDKGRSGFIIGKDASDNLYTGFLARKISEAKTLAIAKAAPGNESLQTVGIEYARTNTAEDTGNYLRAIQALVPESRSTQTKIWGDDVEWKVTAAKMGKAASKMIRGLEEERSALRSAKNLSKDKFKEIVERYGIKTGKIEDVEKRIVELEKELFAWEKWDSDPELFNKVREAAGLKEQAGVAEGRGKYGRDTQTASLFGPKEEKFTLTPSESTAQEQAALRGALTKKPTEDELSEALIAKGFMRRSDKGKTQYAYTFRKIIPLNKWLRVTEIADKLWKPTPDGRGAVYRQIPNWVTAGLLDRMYLSDGTPVYAWKGTTPTQGILTEAEVDRLFEEHPRAAIPEEKIQPGTGGKTGNLFGPAKGETLDIFKEGVDKVGEPDVQFAYVPTTAKAQLSIFDFKPVREAPGRVSPSQVVRMASTGNVRWSGTVVRNEADVASLLAGLRKSPQEFFYSVVTDENGTILEIHRYVKGVKAGAMVTGGDVIGRALNVKGAKIVYSVHNHPSGVSELSNEDRILAKGVDTLAKASGLETKFLALGSWDFSYVGKPGEVNNESIPPARRKVSIPLMERQALVRKGVYYSRMETIKDSATAEEAIKTIANNEDGILLLDRKYRPLAFVPFIKGRSMADTTKELFAMAEKVNASAMVIKDDVNSPNRQAYITQLFKIEPTASLQILDVLNKGRSAAGSGEIHTFRNVAKNWTEADAARILSSGEALQVLPSPIWYSQLLRTLENKLPNSGNPQAMKGLIEGWAKKGEFKADELKWSGLDEFLASKTGKVTKQEVIDYLKANQVEIREVTKGGETSTLAKKEIYAIVSAYDKEWANDIKRAESNLDYRIYDEAVTNFLVENYDNRDKIEDYDRIEDLQGQTYKEGGTKFSQLQTPGGENYREIILTSPSVTAGPSHAFSEKDHFAWVRMNDRVDSDGKKILFLEEVQEHDIIKEWKKLNKKEREKTITPTELKRKAEIESKMPFVRNWFEISLRRMLRYAAENGYDKLAWTTGAMQAERYDLRKHIDSITYDSRTGKFYAYKDQISVIQRDNVKPEDIEDLIGKEPAKKLLESKKWDNREGGATYEINGEDLKVGGEGMKGFYDKIIPDYLNKYAKKWGARVGETTLKVKPITTAPERGYTAEEETRLRTIVRGGISVHSLPITDAMKESVMQGQAMFEMKPGMKGERYGQTTEVRSGGLVQNLSLPGNQLVLEDARKAKRILLIVNHYLSKMSGGNQELINETKVELMPIIKFNLSDRSLRSFNENMAFLGQKKGKVAGLTRWDEYGATIQLATAIGNPNIDKTIKHEVAHVIFEKMVTPADYKKTLEFYGGNKEKTIRSFVDFLEGKETLVGKPNWLKRIFLDLKALLVRIRNSLKGITTQEDIDRIFGKMYAGKYTEKQSAETIRGRYGKEGQALSTVGETLPGAEKFTIYKTDKPTDSFYDAKYKGGFRVFGKGESTWAHYDKEGKLVNQGTAWGTKPSGEQLDEWGIAVKDALNSWLGQYDKIYIRFGDLPKEGISRHWQHSGKEKGISAYTATKDYATNSIWYDPNAGRDGYREVPAAALLRISQGAPVYAITGKRVGYGSDNEPVLKDVKVIGRLKLHPNNDVAGYVLREAQESLLMTGEKGTGERRMPEESKRAIKGVPVITQAQRNEYSNKYGPPSAIDVGYGPFGRKTGSLFIDDETGKAVAYLPFESPLTEAKRMEAKGVPMEDIRQKTGWVRAPWKEGKDHTVESAAIKVDGEVYAGSPLHGNILSKNKVKLKGNEDIQYGYVLDDGRFLTTEETRVGVDRDLSHGGLRAGKAVWSEGGKWRFEIDDSKAKVSFADDVGTKRLSDVLTHPDLFNSYPELKNVFVAYQVGENRKSSAGSFARLTQDVPEVGAKIGDWRMVVHAPNPEEAKSTLIHEIQHTIQEHEGFARGGSPQGETLTATAAERVARDKIFNESNEAMRRYKEARQKWLDSGRKDTAVEREMNVAKDEHSKLLRQFEETIGSGKYRRLAGEYEARDAASRMGLTAEERKTQRPYTSEGMKPEDLIVRMEGGQAADISARELFTIKKEGKYQSEYNITDDGWEVLKSTPYAAKLRQASTRETLGSRDQLKDLFYIGRTPYVIPRDAGFTKQDVLKALQKAPWGEGEEGKLWDRVQKLPGEDIARAEADGTITVDPDKFFGHSKKDQLDIIRHEQAHFVESEISPEYKAKLFDNKEVMGYRGRNINEKLANMIQDGKVPNELVKDYPFLGRSIVDPNLGKWQGVKTVYRAGGEPYPGTGTWYWQNPQPGLADRIKTSEITLKNPLVISQGEIDANIAQAGVPSTALLSKWFPEYDKAEGGLPRKQTITPRESDRIVAEEAKRRGYDAIVYGEGESGAIQYVGEGRTPTVSPEKAEGGVIKGKMPEGAVLKVSIPNAAPSGGGVEGYLGRNGKVLVDGNWYEPTDIAYWGMSDYPNKTKLYNYPHEKVLASFKRNDGNPERIRTLHDAMWKADRNIPYDGFATSERYRNVPQDLRLQVRNLEGDGLRLPSEKQIEDYFLDRYLKNYHEFRFDLGSYLHLTTEPRQLSPNERKAIKEWEQAGGSLGRTALVSLERGEETKAWGYESPEGPEKKIKPVPSRARPPLSGGREAFEIIPDANDPRANAKAYLDRIVSIKPVNYTALRKEIQSEVRNREKGSPRWQNFLSESHTRWLQITEDYRQRQSDRQYDQGGMGEGTRQMAAREETNVRLSDEKATGKVFETAYAEFAERGYEMIPVTGVPFGGMLDADAKIVLISTDEKWDPAASALHELFHDDVGMDKIEATDLVSKVDLTSSDANEYLSRLTSDASYALDEMVNNAIDQLGDNASLEQVNHLVNQQIAEEMAADYVAGKLPDTIFKDKSASIEAVTKWEKSRIRYSSLDKVNTALQYLEDNNYLADSEETANVAGKSMLSGMKKKLAPYQATDPRVDLSRIATWLSQPFYAFKKIPAMMRMYLSTDRRRDNAHEFTESLIRNPDGTFRTLTLDKLEKADPKSFKKLADYAIKNDQNRVGYTVKQDLDTQHYHLFEHDKKDPVGKFLRERDLVGKDGNTIEKGAWDEAVRLEGTARLKDGWTPEAVNALTQFRTAMLDAFDRRMKPLRDLLTKYEAEDWKLPEKTINTDEGPVKVDLKVALAEMGDLRGYYFPRIRHSGKYKLIAKGKSKQTWMNFYDAVLSKPVQEGQEVSVLKAGINWATPVGFKVRELKGKGYTDFKISLSERMPEDVFDLAGSTVAMEQVINKALEDIQPKTMKLSAFGLTTTERKVGKKDPNWNPSDKERKTAYRDFMVHGPTNKAQNDIFKELGGRWYYEAGKGTPQVWHFQNPGANFEKRLARRLSVTLGNVDKSMWDLFAGQLAEHVANIYKGRGDRQHMIARSPAKGEEVWIGYETHPTIALAKYALGQGASEAKHINATEMVRAMTGTDIPWARYRDIAAYEGTYDEYMINQSERLDRKDFKDVNMPDTIKENQAKVDELKDQEDLTDEQEKELEDAENFLYDSYRGFVKERRVDAAKQPNAFREAKSYMSDMLRNDEMMDRAMGFVKGLATLKYLAGRVSAPAVNLTALATSVPATFNSKLGVPLSKAFMYIGSASKAYGQFLWPKKMGTLRDADYQKAFDHIRAEGWNIAQFNREALGVLESKFGRTWNKMIEGGMWMFGVTEQLNRVATIAGAFKAIRDTKPSMPFDQAIAFAKDVSDTAHAAYFKGNLPGWARKSGLAGNAGRAFYVFKTFSHNYLLNMAQMWGKGWTPEHAKAFAWMAISPMILAGGGAMVGRELIAAMAKALGIGGDDPEEEFYAWLMKNTGETGERIGRFGLFGLAGVSAKGSLEIALTDLPTSLIDLLGAPGSMVKDMGDAFKLYARGDAWKATEKVMPNAITNMMRAYREGTEGATTWTNAPVFYGTKPLMADMGDSIARFLSFNPAPIARVKEIQWKERAVETKYSEMCTDIYAKFKKFIMQPGEKQSKAAYADLLAEVQGYNDRVINRGLVYKGIPVITSDSIRTNILKAMQPTKKEKLRAANE